MSLTRLMLHQQSQLEASTTNTRPTTPSPTRSHLPSSICSPMKIKLKHQGLIPGFRPSLLHLSKCKRHSSILTPCSLVTTHASPQAICKRLTRKQGTTWAVWKHLLLSPRARIELWKTGTESSLATADMQSCTNLQHNNHSYNDRQNDIYENTPARTYTPLTLSRTLEMTVYDSGFPSWLLFSSFFTK